MPALALEPSSQDLQRRACRAALPYIRGSEARRARSVRRWVPRVSRLVACRAQARRLPAKATGEHGTLVRRLACLGVADGVQRGRQARTASSYSHDARCSRRCATANAAERC
jgi:hypothetical protein